MKISLIISIIFISLFSLSQEELVNINYSLTAEKFNDLFVIDSTHYPREKVSWSYSKSKTIHFLNIDEKILFIRAIFRRNHSFLGEIDGLKVVHNEKGQKTITFYTRGKGYNTGQVISFDIIELSGSNYIIHYYNKFGEVNDVYFYAHKASKTEQNKISEQSNNFNKKSKR